MNARQKTYDLMRRGERYGLDILGFEDMNTIRRISMTLSSWGEKECGSSGQYSSWAIERDEKTDLPYIVTYYDNGKVTRRRIADKEKGALKRLNAMSKILGFRYYYQTDPRGCALYISINPLNDQNYSTNGLAVC